MEIVMLTYFLVKYRMYVIIRHVDVYDTSAEYLTEDDRAAVPPRLRRIGVSVKSSAKASQDEGAFSAYRPQYEIVAEKIVEFISNTGLQPGDRLPTEQKLGEQLGVSRGIVREAIKSLTATGLVAARKGVGVYVAGRPHLIAMPTLHLSMTVDPEHIQA